MTEYLDSLRIPLQDDFGDMMDTIKAPTDIQV